ncbi:MAG: alpha-L-rhamnosidase N-terminal domain-containing protein, partial [Clostridia bacterium]|nr:alpha-L-rhamnosidase N-terminal domain-containing protein [Clostridia bacterium]
MSLKSFTAKWIAPENCTNLPVLKKTFTIDTTFKKAEIFISGLGLFELHINGTKAHDTYFEPGESVYEKTVFYSVFDV